jgi:hypothetical protein
MLNQYNSSMWADLLAVVGIAAIIYDFGVGQVRLRTFTVRRSEHPLWFWILTLFYLAVAVGCAVVLSKDLYRGMSR